MGNRPDSLRTTSLRATGITEWAAEGACRNSNPDDLFVQGAAQNRAKMICRGCPVRVACLADSLDNKVEFGVWGGMTERERRALLRRRPNVTSWRRLLEAAARDHTATADPRSLTAIAG
ncbi:MAG: WhiB family transcriptional regulator, redox-sensing transcriptional regulator [Frankiales bacterium]|nr:WhiB family transcriptional regulator, redox-sensing transcriptional regulator [Frankiales bacterium]